LEILEDQGEVLKSPTSLASLSRVSAGCLKDLFGSGPLSGHRLQGDWLALPSLFFIELTLHCQLHLLAPISLFSSLV
jgi:hypothetical protein